MNVIKFMKIDYKMTKSQNRLLILFAILAVIISTRSNVYMWGMGYLCFGAIILSTAPFSLEQDKSCGFIQLLPATTLSRVIGRYLYSLALIAFSSVIGILCSFISFQMKDISLDNLSIPVFFIIIAAAIMVNTIQYVILYIAGNIRSQQVMGLLRMVPVFLFFFAGNYFIGFVQKNQDKGIRILNWMQENISIVALIVVVLAAIIFWIGIAVSYMVIKNRDME